MNDTETAQHTPGPWDYRHTFIETLTTGKRVLCVYGPRNSGPDHSTKIVHVCEDPTAQDEANARLIAAAPALLIACKAALQAINNQGPTDVLWVEPPYQAPAIHETVWERLTEVIGKAEPEGSVGP